MSYSSASFYNKISPLYPAIDWFLKQHKTTLVNIINSFPNGSILELGVGHGNYLSHYIHTHITAIDDSNRMLQKAKALNSSNISFFKMNAQQLDFEDRQFDYVIAAHLLSVSENPNQVIKEALRVLKPEGKLIILNHFSEHPLLKGLDFCFQPIAKLFHFNSFFNRENLTELNDLKCCKALKFGLLKNYHLLVFEK